MPSILIPVDFSLPCHNAYRYGLHLAREFNLGIVLAHYYASSIDPNHPLIIAGDGSIRGSYEQRLRDFAMSTAEGVDYPLLEPPADVEITFETEVVFSVTASIIARAARKDIRMIVMAPRSSDAIMGRWLGSTTTTVSEASHRPVCIVPDGVKYEPYRRIVVANNHLVADTVPLKQLEEIAVLHEANVHFVHVDWPEKFGPLNFVPWRLMEKLVQEKPGTNYPFTLSTVKHEDITEGLLQYAKNIGADLLVIVNGVRNRWRSLLHASLTQDVALRTNLPVMVLHTGAAAELNDGLIQAAAATVN